MASLSGEGMPSVAEITAKWDARHQGQAEVVDKAITQVLGGRMVRAREGRPRDFFPEYSVPIRRRPWSTREDVELWMDRGKFHIDYIQIPTAGWQDVDPEVAAKVLRGDLKRSLQRQKEFASRPRRWSLRRRGKQ